jgi:hypothetical protein
MRFLHPGSNLLRGDRFAEHSGKVLPRRVCRNWTHLRLCADVRVRYRRQTFSLFLVKPNGKVLTQNNSLLTQLKSVLHHCRKNMLGNMAPATCVVSRVAGCSRQGHTRWKQPAKSPYQSGTSSNGRTSRRAFTERQHLQIGLRLRRKGSI